MELQSSEREELHFRRIDMRGYRRRDGLYEVEGRLVDRKPHDMKVPSGDKVVPANEAIHEMGVVMVFDENLLVHEVSTFTDAAPYLECPQGGDALRSLRGLHIASGWSKEVRARLRGAQSCTHLMELLIPLGTAAFQSLSSVRHERPEPLTQSGRPAKIDSCYAFRASGQVVMKRWPAFSTADALAPDAAAPSEKMRTE